MRGSVNCSVAPYSRSLRVWFSQGTYLGCGLSPPLGHVQDATDGCFCLTFSLSRSLSLSLLPSHPPSPLFLSVSKINKYILGWGLKNKKKCLKIGLQWLWGIMVLTFKVFIKSPWLLNSALCWVLSGKDVYCTYLLLRKFQTIGRKNCILNWKRL